MLVGCQMQFWGMMTMFCSQVDVQRHQLRRLEQAIASIDPGPLCARWLESTGSLDSLLWTLCNAGVSVLHLDGKHALATGPLPHWLQPAVAHILEHLELEQTEDLRARLQQMPFAERWNDRACQALPVWLNDESTSPSSTSTTSSDTSSHSSMSTFGRLRLDLDYWLESFPRKDNGA